MQFVKKDCFQEFISDSFSPIFSCTDQGISQECALNTIRVITNGFQGLQSLNLALERQTEITDELCLKLGKGILENMIYLKSLNLDFSG